MAPKMSCLGWREPEEGGRFLGGSPALRAGAAGAVAPQAAPKVPGWNAATPAATTTSDATSAPPGQGAVPGCPALAGDEGQRSGVTQARCNHSPWEDAARDSCDI